MLSILLVLYEGNPLVDTPHTQSFADYFAVIFNKLFTSSSVAID